MLNRAVRTAALVSLLLLAGCSLSSRRPAMLSQEEARAFATKVEAMTANLLTSFSNHDLAAHTRDMDAQMRAATETQFEAGYQAVIGKIGKYLSHTMVRVEEQGQLRAVVYDARFEQEEHVTVRVIYSVAEAVPKVSGLWFDSPKLRQP